jgi:hypothetical protein
MHPAIAGLRRTLSTVRSLLDTSIRTDMKSDELNEVIADLLIFLSLFSGAATFVRPRLTLSAHQRAQVLPLHGRGLVGYPYG